MRRQRALRTEVPIWGGRSAPGDIGKAGAGPATADAAAVSQEPALRLIPGRQARTATRSRGRAPACRTLDGHPDKGHRGGAHLSRSLAARAGGRAQHPARVPGGWVMRRTAVTGRAAAEPRSPGRRTGPGTTPGQTGWITTIRAGSAIVATELATVRCPSSRCTAIRSSLRPCRNSADSTDRYMGAAPNPRILTGWFGASSYGLRFPVRAFLRFPVCPPGLFPFVRLPPVSLRSAFSSSVPSAVAFRFGSPSDSLRVPFSLSNLHVSAAAKAVLRALVPCGRDQSHQFPARSPAPIVPVRPQRSARSSARCRRDRTRRATRDRAGVCAPSFERADRPHLRGWQAVSHAPACHA